MKKPKKNIFYELINMLYNRNGSDIVHYVINIGTSMYNIYENVFKARPLTDNLKYI